jgi:dTDP-4-amino-4,6-dideoxygalactose transaminase
VGQSVPFIFRPSFSAQDRAALDGVLASGMVATGERTHAFERAIASSIGSPAAVATNSGTSAMTLALEVLGIGAGDEVITPSLTCVGVVNAIARSGAIPVFADLEEDTLCLDPASVRAAASARTKAIVPVHYGGHPFDGAGMRAVADDIGATIIGDLAHALGATQDGAPVGSFGDLNILSFHATKIITTGEGGMLAGGIPEIERARLDTRHGLGDDVPGSEAEFSGSRWMAPGLKLGMSDLAASLGLSQFASLRDRLAARRHAAELYTGAFDGTPGLVTPIERPGTRSSWHFYTLRMDPAIFGNDAGAFIQGVRERGGAASRQFFPAHLMPLFSGVATRAAVPLPVTERESFVSMSLPVYPGITDDDILAVAEAVLATAAALS